MTFVLACVVVWVFGIGKIPFVRRWNRAMSLLWHFAGHSKPFNSISGYSVQYTKIDTFTDKWFEDNAMPELLLDLWQQMAEHFVKCMRHVCDLLLCLGFQLLLYTVVVFWALNEQLVSIEWALFLFQFAKDILWLNWQYSLCIFVCMWEPVVCSNYAAVCEWCGLAFNMLNREHCRIIDNTNQFT